MGSSVLSMMAVISFPQQRIGGAEIRRAPLRESLKADADRVYPGDGILDLREMISILKAAGYARTISLELFNPSYWEDDPREVARIGLEKMKAVVEG
jgi:2-keto-myo-inositol isomerase